ncbi:hypothetical protein RBH76_14130 [Oscillospiraceae bacterium MB24-C1]|nr:hypothetical protein RBH76_14130 [Oscillospiraceae bacterium MB24-C1]
MSVSGARGLVMAVSTDKAAVKPVTIALKGRYHRQLGREKNPPRSKFSIFFIEQLEDGQLDPPLAFFVVCGTFLPPTKALSASRLMMSAPLALHLFTGQMWQQVIVDGKDRVCLPLPMMTGCPARLPSARTVTPCRASGIAVH